MESPSIKKNFIYSTIYQILVLLLPFITAPYVSRVLGADGIGIYSYTSSVMAFFTLFAALGTVSYGSREIARHRDDRAQASKIFWEIELITVGTSLLCLLVWLGVIIFSAAYRYYYMALIPVLLGTMFDVSWFYNGLEQMKYNIIRNSICKIVGVVLIFVLVHEKTDLLLYILLNSFITMLGNLSMWTYLPRFLVHIDFREIQLKNHLKETLIYFVPTIATSIYTILDKTLIGIITKDSYENGYYEQATKIINMIKALVFTSINTVMGPRISYLFAQDKVSEIKRRIEESIDFILLLGYGCVFGLFGIAGSFVPIYFGAGYEGVIQLLYILAPIVLIIGVSNCLGSQYYTPAGLRTFSSKIIIAGAVTNLCMNLLLIPNLGSQGAAIGSVIAELLITVLYVRFCKGYITLEILWKHSRKRIAAGLFMFGIVKLLYRLPDVDTVWSMGIQIISGVISYGVVLLIMKDETVCRYLCKVTHLREAKK